MLWKLEASTRPSQERVKKKHLDVPLGTIAAVRTFLPLGTESFSFGYIRCNLLSMWSAIRPLRRRQRRARVALSARWTDTHTPKALSLGQPSIFTSLHSLHTALYNCLSVYLPAYLSIHLPVCLSICLFIAKYFYICTELDRICHIQCGISPCSVYSIFGLHKRPTTPLLLRGEGPRETHAMLHVTYLLQVHTRLQHTCLHMIKQAHENAYASSGGTL